ncbi:MULTISPECIES: hypothetical protein [unclassified Pseudoalteromonas]|uniref:hypothetical protein n=1 Tax=unclassified Pseudoalteromonas TaxID=194690 RepID=UPI0007B8B8FF|nr:MULTISPECIES: hypothetical protein [unclassified Pseudoalteromonas]KZY42284.1 hypothetical protein A3733_20460 [Pseudoalteromonas shioyasakiensis]RZF77955.1 hypothetical protein EXT43_17800 [Pseudoalteromonas sp. CO109Y]TMO36237.1 hypothetical protein CWC27_08685 [Pseudoalteromonas sp. S4491]TMO38292.1 hypothetical protein CWC26_11805 [Pseudoalteromonas sp. S4488]
MDALSKLQEKNKIHSKHQRNASWSAVWVFLLMSPLLSSYGSEFYFSVIKNIQIEAPHPFIVLFGSLCFGLPLLAIGDCILFKRVNKLLLLIIAEAWFIWFWVVNPLSWLAFLPLIPAFVILQIQLPQIRTGK